MYSNLYLFCAHQIFVVRFSAWISFSMKWRKMHKHFRILSNTHISLGKNVTNFMQLKIHLKLYVFWCISYFISKKIHPTKRGNWVNLIPWISCFTFALTPILCYFVTLHATIWINILVFYLSCLIYLFLQFDFHSITLLQMPYWPNDLFLFFNIRMQLMRRSMKRLKTFKQSRSSEGPTNEPNSIPLESIGGKHVTSILIWTIFPHPSNFHVLVHDFQIVFVFNIYLLLFYFLFSFMFLHVAIKKSCVCVSWCFWFCIFCVGFVFILMVYSYHIHPQSSVKIRHFVFHQPNKN